MSIAIIVLGFSLVIVGVLFAIRGFGTAQAGGSAVKSFSIQGPSWLILVALGAGTILYGAWLYKDNEASSPAPAPAPVIETTSTFEEFVPWTYGDDPLLDEYWDRCETGEANLLGCDELYNNSEEDSDYEYFGATCGYRIDQPVWFVDGMSDAASCQEWAQKFLDTSTTLQVMP